MITEEHCTALVRPPFNLLPSLLPLLKPETDVKIQHALVGLLKNLSVPDSNKDLMADEGVMEGVSVGMGTLEDKRDVVGSVQGGAVGVVKNLCKGSRESFQSLDLSLLLPDPTSFSLRDSQRGAQPDSYPQSKVTTRPSSPSSSPSSNVPTILPSERNPPESSSTPSDHSFPPNRLTNPRRRSRGPRRRLRAVRRWLGCWLAF